MCCFSTLFKLYSIVIGKNIIYLIHFYNVNLSYHVQANTSNILQNSLFDKSAVIKFYFYKMSFSLIKALAIYLLIKINKQTKRKVLKYLFLYEEGPPIVRTYKFDD